MAMGGGEGKVAEILFLIQKEGEEGLEGNKETSWARS